MASVCPKRPASWAARGLAALLVAGLEPGDKITRIGNVVNPRFDDLRTGVTLGDVDKGIPFTIDRAANDKPEDIMLFPDSSLGLPMIGIISA